MKAVICIPPASHHRSKVPDLATLTPPGCDVKFACLIIDSEEAYSHAYTLPPVPIVRLIHPDLAGMDVDTLAYVASVAIRALEADLAIFTERDDAEGLGVIPARVAHHLGAQLFSHVTSIRVVGQPHPHFVLGLLGGGKRLEIGIDPPIVVATALGLLPSQGVSPAPFPQQVSSLGFSDLPLDPTKLVTRPTTLGDLEKFSPDKPTPTLSQLRDLLFHQSSGD